MQQLPSLDCETIDGQVPLVLKVPVRGAKEIKSLFSQMTDMYWIPPICSVYAAWAHLIFIMNLYASYGNSHFTGKKTEVQRDEIT